MSGRPLMGEWVRSIADDLLDARDDLEPELFAELLAHVSGLIGELRAAGLEGELAALHAALLDTPAVDAIDRYQRWGR
jgi:hypothetical protein